MKVVTLLENDFEQECKRLADLVSSNYTPDLVVGILTGGGYVGKRIFNVLKAKSNVKYIEIRIERGGTEIKRKYNLKHILHSFPDFILNFLRIVEVHILEVLSKIRVPKRHSNISISEDIRTYLEEGQRRILIVDDCIDTGASLKCVLDYIKSEFRIKHDLKIAVITKAHRKPLVEVDYLLYKRVLIRFPWSFDTKDKKDLGKHSDKNN